MEFWLTPEGQALYDRNDWSLLPFMALSDGAHASLEDYSYFTLLNKSPTSPKSEDEIANIANEGKEYVVREGDGSLFGIACTRQIRVEKLRVKGPEVTRASVQKSVVVVVGSVRGMGELRTRLGMVTEMWFNQGDFSDISILKEFQESLARSASEGRGRTWEAEEFVGMSLRELVYEFREKTLMLVKCLLLQRKMLFFGSKCERLCLLQFALLSLMPGLLEHLEDCAHPSLLTKSKNETEEKPTRTTSRAALHEHVEMPLRVFGEGAFFGPYTPLQHLDILASYSTKSYVVGSTNSLLLQAQSRYADVLINLDEEPISISILSPSLKQALQLSAADRRWADYLTQTVLDTWDPENPSRPKGMGYVGSEEAIRLQFEEYVLSLCSCVTYEKHRETADGPRKGYSRSRSRSAARDSSPRTSAERSRPLRRFVEPEAAPDTQQPPPPPPENTKVELIEADPDENANDFGESFLAAWSETRNYLTFMTAIEGKRIFEMIEPRHPTAGGLSIEDVQRRLQQNIADLHLDERYKQGREHAGKLYEAGKERWKEGTARFWAELEKRRDSSRTQVREGSVGDAQKENGPASTGAPVEQPTVSEAAAGSWTNALRDRASKVQKPDTVALQAAAKENAAKAGAYLSSWASWGREKGKEWNEQRGRKPTSSGG